MPAAVAAAGADRRRAGRAPAARDPLPGRDARADALFRRGAGLGVRRTALHARARGAGRGARRPGAAGEGRRRRPGRPRAYGGRAAGPLPGGRRRPALGDPAGLRPGSGPAAGASAGTGSRRHYRVAPWTDLVEVYWAAGSEAYVTPVADDLVGVAVLGGRRAAASRPGSPPSRPCGSGSAGAAPASDVARRRPAAAGRPAPHRGPGAARRRRLRLRGRADRRGHRRGAGPGRGAGGPAVAAGRAGITSGPGGESPARRGC